MGIVKEGDVNLTTAALQEEIAAMEKLSDILDNITTDAVARVLRWAIDHYDVRVDFVIRAKYQSEDELGG